MSKATLEERVATLEKQVAHLLASQPSQPTGFKDWHRAIGLFPQDDLMKKIDAAGQAIREADRRRAHRRQGAKRRTKT
jgi:hypothetical protein